MSGVHPLRSHAQLDSSVHRAPALVKLLVTLALVAGVACVPVERCVWTAAPLVAILLVGRAAGVPVSAILLRLAVVQPFVLSVALLALFQGRGLTVFAAIALKTTTCVAALQLLSHTTPVSDILRAMTAMRVPRALVVALGLLDRFLHVLLEESRRMRRARAARTWRRGRWVAWRFLASVVAVSFIRSMARAERVAVAMRARGWS